MKTDRKWRLGFEDLEPRWTPSASAAAAPAVAITAAPDVSRMRAAPVGRALPIQGQISGRMLATLPPAGDSPLPTSLQLSGGGRVAPLGQVTLEGRMDTSSGRPESGVSLLLFLHNPRGNLTMRLTSTHAGDPGPRGAKWDATVIDGDGVATNLRGIGSARVRFRMDPPASLPPGGPAQGSFQITLALRPPVR